MNVTNINRSQASGSMSIRQPSQDSHEKDLQKQIVNLQGKMRDITYNNDMSTEEKSNEKKSLQEQIKSLNSELKQYQIQKRQEEAEKRQKDAAKEETEKETSKKETSKKETARKEAVKRESPKKEAAKTDPSKDEASQRKAVGNQTGKTEGANTSENDSDNTTAAENAGSSQSRQTDNSESGVNDSQAGTMISIANTKESLSNMQKIRTDLEGQMRTAATDEEKSKLQKKLNNVSRNMGEKIQKISDTITDTQNEDKARKENVKKALKNFSDRMKNMNVSVSKNSKSSPKYDEDWDDNSAMPGKVLLTRKKS